MSIHGICFDEGQSGNCGPNCSGFKNNECNIEDEILSISYDNAVKFNKELFYKYLLGAVRYEVLSKQTKINVDIDKLAKEISLSMDKVELKDILIEVT